MTNATPGDVQQFGEPVFPYQGLPRVLLFLGWRANANGERARVSPHAESPGLFAEDTRIGYKFQPGNLPFGDYDEDPGFGVADRNKTRLLVIEARWPRVHEHNRINSGNRQDDGRLRRGLIRKVVGERQERQLA